MADIVSGQDVDVLTVPADPFGVNADAASATGSISAKLRFIASTGIPVTGTSTVAGSKSNNNAAPGATNVGALVAVANAIAPGQTEGNLVALRTNLAGDVAITLDAETVATQEVSPGTIRNGKKTVAVAGTRETLAGSSSILSVTVKALSTNNGMIYVGNSSVTSATGFQLAAGESVSMDVSNLVLVNIDASVSGNGVTYLAVYS